MQQVVGVSPCTRSFLDLADVLGKQVCHLGLFLRGRRPAQSGQGIHHDPARLLGLAAVVHALLAPDREANRTVLGGHVTVTLFHGTAPFLAPALFAGADLSRGATRGSSSGGGSSVTTNTAQVIPCRGASRRSRTGNLTSPLCPRDIRCTISRDPTDRPCFSKKARY